MVPPQCHLFLYNHSVLSFFDMRPSFLTPLLLALFLSPTIGSAETYDPCKETSTSQDTNGTVPGTYYGHRCEQNSYFEELQLKKKESIEERNARIKQRALDLFQKKYSQSTARRTLLHQRVETIENENRATLLKQHRQNSQMTRSNKRRTIQEKIQKSRPEAVDQLPSGLSKDAQKMCADFQGIRQQVCLRKEARGSR